MKPCIEFIPSTQGVRIPLRTYGVEAGGTPLIMLHGLQSHSGWFTQSASFIANMRTPVYAMDRYGSGMSEAPRGGFRSLEGSIEDIDRVIRHAMDRHGKNSVHLLGHCFGAMLAVAYACANNYKIASLMLPTPAIFTKSDVTFSEKTRILWSSISGRDIRIPVPFDSAMLSELDEYVDFIKSDKLALKDLTGKFFFEVGRIRNFVKKNSQKITAPVFMALAGEDQICQNSRNKLFFQSLMSDKKVLKTYPRARHILEFSAEKEHFFKDLAAWLDSCA